MDKIAYFNKEYTYIKDDKIREDLKQLVSKLPDYFFEIQAASTGKYHPAFAASEHGLVKHTKAAAKIAYDLLGNPGIHNFTNREKDLIIMSLILHDGLKSGKVKERYTRVDHPLLVCDFIKENSKLPTEDIELLTKMISSHMGIWNTDFDGNEVLPKPKDKYQRFVHMCDYLAAQKWLDVKFNGNEIRSE